MPGFISAMRRASSPERSIGLPSSLSTTSPALRPARSAGLSFSTELTRAPVAVFMPNELARAWLISWMETPSRPRTTRPWAASWFFTSSATSIGIANDTPW